VSGFSVELIKEKKLSELIKVIICHYLPKQKVFAIICQYLPGKYWQLPANNGNCRQLMAIAWQITGLIARHVKTQFHRDD